MLPGMSLHPPSTTQDIKTRLLQRQAQLLAELGKNQDEALSLSRNADHASMEDPREHAEAQERSAVRDAEAARDHDELVAVRSALARLRAGSYGACIDCGSAIAPARLQAQPAASRCIPCQDREEEAGHT